MSADRALPALPRGLAATAAILALVGSGLLVAPPASAATSLTVTTTADGDANGACTTPSVTTTATPVTLRNALCVASNTGGVSIVSVPDGTYTLTDGALVLGTRAGTDVTLESIGGRAEIVGDGDAQILTLDPDIVGGIAVEIDGFTFRGGRDDVFGGGAIIGGSIDAPSDTLLVRDSTFIDNASSGGAANPGGAIQFIGGDLTIQSSRFERNTSGSANGGAVYYEAAAPGDYLDVSGSTFTQNTLTAAGTVSAGGGAIAVDGGGSVAISGNVFDRNTASGPTARGGAIQQLGGPATISKNVFTQNTAVAGGAAIDATGGALTARGNSFTGNTGTAAVTASASAPVTAPNNWWGCNGGANAAGCDTTAITTGTTEPHLVLSATAGAATVDSAASTAITASLRTNSAGASVSAIDLSAFDGRSVTWTDVQPAGATTAAPSSLFSGGTATTTFVAGPTPGQGGVTANLDAASVRAAVAVRQQTAFTSADAAAATLGQPFSFSVTASGFPTPTVARTTGDLPPGVTLSGSGATLLLAGTPTSVGTFPVTFSASNGDTSATQVLTITVGQAPSFAGPLTATVAAGAPVEVTLSTVGTPPAVITATDLPTGLALDAGTDGTAKLSGTPTVAPGEYRIPLTATNDRGQTSAEFVLTLTAPPSFTSPATGNATVGVPFDFPIVVDPGYPALNAVALTVAPAWITLVGAPGDQRLVGTPPALAGGTASVTLHIVGSTVTQRIDLTVDEAPAITAQPASVTVNAGSDAVFSASATGSPAPTVQWQRNDGDGWIDVAGATSTTLTVTTTIADDGARLRAVFTNIVGSATSDEAVLTVGERPVLAPIDPVTVLAGGKLMIDVRSSGLPAGALSAAPLPAWLTFTDDGDGTGTLTGTPALDDAGRIEVVVTIDNGFGTDSTTATIRVADTVPPPFAAPEITDGALTGVPPEVIRGQQLTIGGGGYLPGATVQLTMYSSPVPLGAVVADAQGEFRIVVTVPADQVEGAHTIVSSGIGAEGTPRFLAADTELIVPAAPGQPGGTPGTPGAPGSGGSGGTAGGDPAGDGLAATGPETSASALLALLAALAVIGGAAVFRSARRRAA